MKDLLGKLLIDWRIKKVLPYIEGKLLDIGCGTNQLVGKYGNGVGVDVHQWGSVDLILKNTACLPFNNNSFDTITIIAALNHIPNRKKVLKEVHRILRPDGKIVITMIHPLISKVWHFLRKPWDADQQERKMKKGEVFGLTKNEIEKMFQETNFKVIKIKKFMFFINNIIIGRKINNS